MNKNDYWNEKAFEKYQKMKVGMEYENLDFERVKKFSKITNRIIKAITIPAIIIGVLTIVIAFSIVILYWKGINEQLNYGTFYFTCGCK